LAAIRDANVVDSIYDWLGVTVSARDTAFGSRIVVRCTLSLPQSMFQIQSLRFNESSCNIVTKTNSESADLRQDRPFMLTSAVIPYWPNGLSRKFSQWFPHRGTCLEIERFPTVNSTV